MPDRNDPLASSPPATAPHTLGPVLAATDLSAPARHAVARAAQVALAAASELTLVHAAGGSAVKALQQWLALTPEATLKLQAQALHELDTLAETVTQRHGLSVRQLLVDAEPVTGILQSAEDIEAGLLVVGASGANYLRRTALGSTAERLLQRSSRPVLIVKQPPHENYRRVLVPVDFSGASGIAIRLARDVAPQAHLVLLHAWSVPLEGKLQFAGVEPGTVQHYRERAEQEAGQSLRDLAAAESLEPGQWTACAVPGEAAQSIVQQEQENDCDLIVVGKQGRHALDLLLLGSVTRRVLAETQADTLVVQLPGPA